MDNERFIRSLKAVAKKHKNDNVYTFETNVSEMAMDCARKIQELHERNMELERLTEIGKATELAFEKSIQATFVTCWHEGEDGEYYADTNSSFDIGSIEDLLVWASKEGEG